MLITNYRDFFNGNCCFFSHYTQFIAQPCLAFQLTDKQNPIDTYSNKIYYYESTLAPILLQGSSEMNRIGSSIILIFLSCLILFLIGCENSDSLAPDLNDRLSSPRVTGLRLTDEFGQDYGPWGNSWGSLNMYPNPSIGNIRLGFFLLRDTHVKIRVVRALGPYEEEHEIVRYNGAGIPIIPGSPVATLVDSDTFFDGYGVYNVEWGCKDDLGQPLPPGFYRIYLETSYRNEWWNLLLLDDCYGIPYNIEVPVCR